MAQTVDHSSGHSLNQSLPNTALSSRWTVVRRGGLLALWLGLIIYAIGFAPPLRPDTPMLIQSLVLGQWSGINPLVIALFNIMGLWPVIYASVALVDGRSQSFPVWPFVVASFGLGAFALLPYLAFRQANTRFDGSPDLWIRRTESRWVGLIVLILGVGLLLFGLLAGSWSDFLSQWRTSQFIHVMSIDFCLLCVLFPLLLGDDMVRRGLTHRWIFWGVAIAPLIGPSLYLCLRPPLIDPNG